MKIGQMHANTKLAVGALIVVQAMLLMIFLPKHNHNMSYEITGKLAAKFDTNQRSETFRVREFVVEKQEDINGRMITNYIKLQCTQDKTTMIDRFNLGDEVKVFFNLKGNKSERDGRTSYFTNLDAWRIESLKIGQQNYPANSNDYNDMPPPADDVLPF